MTTIQKTQSPMTHLTTAALRGYQSRLLDGEDRFEFKDYNLLTVVGKSPETLYTHYQFEKLTLTRDDILLSIHSRGGSVAPLVSSISVLHRRACKSIQNTRALLRVVDVLGFLIVGLSESTMFSHTHREEVALSLYLENQKGDFYRVKVTLPIDD